MNVFTNLLRSLLGRQGVFRNGGYGNSYYINKGTPIYIDMANLPLVLEACPYLKIPIMEKAKMFSNMDIKLVRIDDESDRILKHPVLDLLRQPNVLQNTEEWLKQYSVFNDVFANNFIYKLAPTSTSFPKALWNLPSGQMQVVPTGKLYKQTKIEDIIQKYIHNFEGVEVNYPTNEIIFTTENATMLIGESIIPSLQVPISNIIGALKTRNVIINDRGALGILSTKSSDSAGAMPLNPKERERIEKEYKAKYGIFQKPNGEDKSNVLIANTEVKWEAMSFPTKDLMLFEEIEEDFAAILGAYGLDRDIFPSTKGATFENKAQALKSTYQNTIQPAADRLMRTFDNNLGITNEGLKLVADYSYMPIMQEDKEKQAKEKKALAEALSIMLRDGVISHETYANIADVEFTGDMTFQQNNPTPQQANN